MVVGRAGCAARDISMCTLAWLARSVFDPRRMNRVPLGAVGFPGLVVPSWARG